MHDRVQRVVHQHAAVHHEAVIAGHREVVHHLAGVGQALELHDLVPHHVRVERAPQRRQLVCTHVLEGGELGLQVRGVGIGQRRDVPLEQGRCRAPLARHVDQERAAERLAAEQLGADARQRGEERRLEGRDAAAVDGAGRGLGRRDGRRDSRQHADDSASRGAEGRVRLGDPRLQRALELGDVAPKRLATDGLLLEEATEEAALAVHAERLAGRREQAAELGDHVDVLFRIVLVLAVHVRHDFQQRIVLVLDHHRADLVAEGARVLARDLDGVQVVASRLLVVLLDALAAEDADAHQQQQQVLRQLLGDRRGSDHLLADGGVDVAVAVEVAADEAPDELDVRRVDPGGQPLVVRAGAEGVQEEARQGRAVHHVIAPWVVAHVPAVEEARSAACALLVLSHLQPEGLQEHLPQLLLVLGDDLGYADGVRGGRISVREVGAA